MEAVCFADTQSHIYQNMQSRDSEDRNINVQNLTTLLESASYFCFLISVRSGFCMDPV